MSEQAPEQTTPAATPVESPTDTTPAETVGNPDPEQTPAAQGVQTFPLELVKRPTGDRHWNTALGIWETITHAETGEPTQEYALVTTIDGQTVTLETFNAGRLETVARSLNQAQQSSGS
jgi:hypothetical protein